MRDNIQVIFLDMDNTVAENKTCDNVPFTPGLYISKRPIQIVIDAVETLYPNIKRVVISKPQGEEEGIKEKMLWLNQHFSKPFDDYIFLKSSEGYYMKGVYIDQWLQKHEIPNQEALIVDDSKQVLRYCKAYDIQTKYPQQLICDYEEHIKKLKLSNNS